MKPLERGTVVVLTHNHKVRLLRTLHALESLPDGWPIIVVDNGSSDGTAEAVGRDFPAVMLIRSRRNIGAAARNIAVAYVHTPYVAFSDDDVMWQPGSLQKASDLMDAHPRVATVSGRIHRAAAAHVGPDLADGAGSHHSEGHNLPQFGFQPDACVVRTRAFYDAGGFWPPMFADGAEVLLALDMADKGWHMIYTDAVVCWRAKTAAATDARRLRRSIRNLIWTAWMRLPTHLAWQETVLQLRQAAHGKHLKAVLASVIAGIGNVLQHRRVVSSDVAAMWAMRYSHAAFIGDPSTPASRHRQSMV